MVGTGLPDFSNSFSTNPCSRSTGDSLIVFNSTSLLGLVSQVVSNDLFFCSLRHTERSRGARDDRRAAGPSGALPHCNGSSEPVVFATDGTMCVPVNGALHVARGEEREGITRVDSKGAILRLHPAPFPSRVVSNLESRHRLAEEKSEGAQI